MRLQGLAWLMGLILVVLPTWGQESGGNRAYRNGEYERAVERYREAVTRGGEDPRLRYNLGTALLRSGRPEEARGELEGALATQSAELRARAFYNLGNAWLGGSEPTSKEELRAALEAYRRTLLLDPANDDARWNYELASRRLDELERSASLSGSEPQRRREGESEEPDRGERSLPGEGEAPESFGEARSLSEVERSLAGDTPLPIELAEQILRAVEERERGLQREKLRRKRQRTSAPDW